MAKDKTKGKQDLDSARGDEEMVAMLSDTAGQLASLATRVAADKEFTAELVKRQHAGDEDGFQELLRSTGAPVEVSFRPTEVARGETLAAARKRNKTSLTIDIGLNPPRLHIATTYDPKP